MATVTVPQHDAASCTGLKEPPPWGLEEAAVLASVWAEAADAVAWPSLAAAGLWAAAGLERRRLRGRSVDLTAPALSQHELNVNKYQ